MDDAELTAPQPVRAATLHGNAIVTPESVATGLVRPHSPSNSLVEDHLGPQQVPATPPSSSPWSQVNWSATNSSEDDCTLSTLSLSPPGDVGLRRTTSLPYLEAGQQVLSQKYVEDLPLSPTRATSPLPQISPPSSPTTFFFGGQITTPSPIHMHRTAPDTNTTRRRTHSHSFAAVSPAVLFAAGGRGEHGVTANEEPEDNNGYFVGYDDDSDRENIHHGHRPDNKSACGCPTASSRRTATSQYRTYHRHRGWTPFRALALLFMVASYTIFGLHAPVPPTPSDMVLEELEVLKEQEENPSGQISSHRKDVFNGEGGSPEQRKSLSSSGMLRQREIQSKSNSKRRPQDVRLAHAVRGASNLLATVGNAQRSEGAPTLTFRRKEEREGIARYFQQPGFHMDGSVQSDAESTFSATSFARPPPLYNPDRYIPVYVLILAGIIFWAGKEKRRRGQTMCEM